MASALVSSILLSSVSKSDTSLANFRARYITSLTWQKGRSRDNFSSRPLLLPLLRDCCFHHWFLYSIAFRRICKSRRFPNRIFGHLANVRCKSLLFLFRYGPRPIWSRFRLARYWHRAFKAFESGSEAQPLLPDDFQPASIVLVRTTNKQSCHEFQRQLNILLFNVERAYWTHYANCVALHYYERGLPARKLHDPIGRDLVGQSDQEAIPACQAKNLPKLASGRRRVGTVLQATS